jgi:hypothetical protein
LWASTMMIMKTIRYALLGTYVPCEASRTGVADRLPK